MANEIELTGSATKLTEELVPEVGNFFVTKTGAPTAAGIVGASLAGAGIGLAVAGVTLAIGEGVSRWRRNNYRKAWQVRSK